MTIAESLAQFLNRTTYDDLPPEAIEHAKMIIASTLASAAPGTQIISGQVIRDLAKEAGGTPEATVWFDGARLPVTAVARANVTLCDAAASDDSDMRNIAHTGNIASSLALAMAERVGARGKDVLAAIATGYEASGRIGAAINPGEGGFHACVITVFAGAVAAGRLLKLNDEQMAQAICLAATSIGGLGMSTNSLGREYHAGFAALSGMSAAMTAQRGYTGDLSILEAPRGFLHCFHSHVAPESILEGLGDEWDINTHLMIKLRPGAHPLSAAVEAAINAAVEGNVDPAQVTKIVASGPRLRALVGHKHPTDLVGAIHSLAYFISCAVSDKDFTWVHATEGKIFDPIINRLQDLVEVDANPAGGYDKYAWGYGATVTITMADGKQYSSTVNAPVGSGPRGIEWSDVDAKYRALMPESGLNAVKISSSLALIHRFQGVREMSELMRMVTL